MAPRDLSIYLRRATKDLRSTVIGARAIPRYGMSHTGCHFNLRIEIRVEMKLRSPKNTEYSRGSPRVYYSRCSHPTWTSIFLDFSLSTFAHFLFAHLPSRTKDRTVRKTRKKGQKGGKEDRKKEMEKVNGDPPPGDSSIIVATISDPAGRHAHQPVTSPDASADASSPAKTVGDSLAGTNFGFPPVTVQRVSSRAAIINPRFRNSQPAPPARLSNPPGSRLSSSLKQEAKCCL
jgi:hypothetical protein